MRANVPHYQGADKRLPRLLESFYRSKFKLNQIASDPISFPHRYAKVADIEVVAFLAAAMAYGRVAGFRQTVEKILALCGERPYRYLMSFNPERERPRFQGIYYRFTRSEDLFSVVHLMSRTVRKYGSMGALFSRLYHPGENDVGPSLSRFVETLRSDLEEITGGELTRGLRHLLPSPKDGSACKRLNLFLRWMVRPEDGIDFGLWTEIPLSKLVIPLDTHIARISGYLCLTSRRTANWKMAEEITAGLKKIDPVDPLKFDFPLCHLGISGDCPVEANPEKCQGCPLQTACARGRKYLRQSLLGYKMK